MRSIRSKVISITACIWVATLASCVPGPGEPPEVQGQNRICRVNSDACNVISGFDGNSLSPDVSGATISGGGGRGEANSVTGDFGTVGGGEGNLAGEGSTVAGGAYNRAVNFHAAIGGGAENEASAQEATVAGGYKNVASERFAAVGGGSLNVASHMHSTVAGGSGNTAGFTFAAVCGGTRNAATSTAAVVVGGEGNLAEGAFSSVLGGLNNDARGYLSAIGGGAGNTASGSYSVVPGGFANSAAADYSVALGRTASVRPADHGTFMFADSTVAAFPSRAANEFAVRATGGARFVTAVDAAGAPISGVRLAAGGGAWETLSDARAKFAFAPVDRQEILEQLAQLPILSWSYTTQDPATRHIGPTAQDFRAAFALGDEQPYISTVDADGVALAAIQELYRMLQASTPTDPPPPTEALERAVSLSNGISVASLALAVAALWQSRKHRSPARPKAF